MNGKRILIADDEEQIRFCVSLALRIKGHFTVTVDNGNAAMDEIERSIIAKQPFDLLICDIQMPGMTGEELINALRVREFHVPFLVITGYGEKSLVVRMLRKGCRDFIDKPFEPEEIEKRVDLILAKDSQSMLEKERMQTMAKFGISTRDLVHDLNNVLTCTNMCAAVTLAKFEKDDPNRAHLTKILKSTSRAAELCATALSASRCPPSGEFALTEMNGLTMESGIFLEDIVPPNITVETKTGETPLWCSVKAERIKQALLNLGINAVQAMDEGGWLTITCHGARESGAPGVRLAVSDTGSGIAQDIMGRIFEYGFTTRKCGNGMGLYMVKKIVEAHSGIIKVDSVVGKGTTFSIDIPDHAAEDRQLTT